MEDRVSLENLFVFVSFSCLECSSQRHELSGKRSSVHVIDLIKHACLINVLIYYSLCFIISLMSHSSALFKSWLLKLKLFLHTISGLQERCSGIDLQYCSEVWTVLLIERFS